MVLESRRRIARRTLAPELLHEPVGPNDLVRMQNEQREQRAALRAANLDQLAVTTDLERAEYEELHRALTVALPSRAENPRNST